jgi:hypothetical protein
VYKPQNDKDPYGLSYADFVVPLVKAVQELSSQNDSLKTAGNIQQQINGSLQKQLDDLKNTINQMQNAMGQCCSSFSSSMTDQKTSSSFGNSSAAKLEQNSPNPFNQNTVIKYFIPLDFHSAQLVVTDLTGRSLKTFEIKNAGDGQQTITANELPSGNYQYRLILNGSIIDSKKMELLR